MSRYLAVDCETTSVRDDADLLTAYLAVYDDKFKLIDELDIKAIPDSGFYHVNPQALAINKIDLVEHSKEALKYKDIKPHLYKFLQTNAVKAKGHLICLGHGVSFDVGKITNTIISRESWEQFVSYRHIDTSVVVQFLQVANILPKNLEAGLGKLIAHYGIEVEGNPHEARYDALATMEVFKKLLQEVKILGK